MIDVIFSRKSHPLLDESWLDFQLRTDFPDRRAAAAVSPIIHSSRNIQAKPFARARLARQSLLTGKNPLNFFA
jgi:hypothetical protein